MKDYTSLETIELHNWEEKVTSQLQDKATLALEEGKVIFLPNLPFLLSQDEYAFLSPSIVDPKAKNISYDLKDDRLSGTVCKGQEALHLKEMIRRYALNSQKLLENLFPHYKRSYIQARTSFRPVEIFGRKTSYRKDDTRLHVDAFPSNPVKGQRILRIFTNINPQGKARVWRTGEPFEEVVKKIAPKVSSPFPGVAKLFQLLRITKGLRSPYDHYMLKIHDTMKGDETYQKTASQEEIHFPPGSSWIVYTDQVSHAAMSGQHVLEQTFYLPIQGLKYENTAPLRVLETYFNKKLV